MKSETIQQQEQLPVWKGGYGRYIQEEKLK